VFFRASNRRIQAFVSATVSANEGGLDRHRQQPRPVACHPPAHPAGRCHAGHREGFLTVRGQAEKYIAYTRSIHCKGPTVQASVHPLLCAPRRSPLRRPVPPASADNSAPCRREDFHRLASAAARCRGDATAGLAAVQAQRAESGGACGFLSQSTVCYICRIMGDAFHPDTALSAHPALRDR